MIVDPKLNNYDFTELDNKVTGATIKTIYDYYNNLATIKGSINLEDYGYIYAPLKEPYFEIDANSRTITVPAVFKTNGIGVKGDNLAETICFSINRYFDTMDLGSEDVRVYINWTLKDESASGKEEAFFVDPIAKPDYLIIGWPLDSIKFDAPGVLRFYLSFEIPGATADTVKYRLNTLPAEVKINNTLDIETENVIEKTNYATTYGVLFNNSNAYNPLEIGKEPTTSLVCDLQPKVEKLDKNATGMRKAIITDTNLKIAAQFVKALDTELTVVVADKNGNTLSSIVVAENENISGQYEATLKEPGVYQMIATPKYIYTSDNGNNVTSQEEKVGIPVKTSQLILMKPMKPIYEINCENPLPATITIVGDKKIIYVPDTGAIADVTINITGLDYSTDNTNSIHSNLDFGNFYLLATIDGAEKPFPCEFTDKSLHLTSAQLQKLKIATKIDLVHELNEDSFVIENFFIVNNYQFISETAEPYVLTPSTSRGTITLSKGAAGNFFTLTKAFVPEAHEFIIWQKATTSTNGRVSWKDEPTTDDTIVVNIGLDASKAYYKSQETMLIDAVKNNYRIKKIRTDATDTTMATTTDLATTSFTYDQFYDVSVNQSLYAVETEG